MQCKWDGYLHPLYPGDEDTGAPAEGPTKDPFADTPATRSDRDCENVGEV